MATIYLSSSLPTLGQFGDRTAILHQGRFVEQQAFAELLASPKMDYTRKAIVSVPRMWSTAEGPLARRRALGEVPLDAGAEGLPNLSRPQAGHLQLLQQCPGRSAA